MRTSEALKAGVHPRTLYALRDNGALAQVSRGVYRLADQAPISNPDLTTVALRILGPSSASHRRFTSTKSRRKSHTGYRSRWKGAPKRPGSTSRHFRFIDSRRKRSPSASSSTKSMA